jgi:ABC-2 type transport system permease protein
LTAVEAVVLMFVVSIALTALGFIIAWRMDSTQGFHAIMSVFLLPMWLLSGAFFPNNVGGWLGWIVAINPLTYGVAGLRWYLQYPEGATAADAAGMPGLGLCWIVSLVFAVVTLGVAWRMAATRSRGDLL